MTRKSLSKKLRFEVFKRDRFTCQYCGAKAPDVVLHADHIEPVSKGGKNEILNLVTACADCNGGKGARRLDDRSVVERQRAQIEELTARREQLEMMLQWRDAAQQETLSVVDEVAQRIAERGGYPPNESGRGHIRRWLKRFSLDEVLTALDQSFDHYMRWDENEPDEDAWELAFQKIPAIASLNKQAADKPYAPRLAYIQGILRRRLRDPRRNFFAEIEEALIRDPDLDLDLLEQAAKCSDTWDEFVELSMQLLYPEEGEH